EAPTVTTTVKAQSRPRTRARLAAKAEVVSIIPWLLVRVQPGPFTSNAATMTGADFRSSECRNRRQQARQPGLGSAPEETVARPPTRSPRTNVPKSACPGTL